MTKEEEDTLYDSCHEEIDGHRFLSLAKIRLAIRAAYARGQEVERERCAKKLLDARSMDNLHIAAELTKLAAAIREGK